MRIICFLGLLEIFMAFQPKIDLPTAQLPAAIIELT